MSGTPWRSDGGNIPFLTPDPETGGYEIQERFDWPEALTGRPPAIRDLAFKPYHGVAAFRFKGGVVELNSRDDLAEEDVARCLRGRVLSQRFCTNIIRDAHAKLLALREVKPNAAGIIVCVDIDHAKKVARLVRNVTGEGPVVAVSDDETASSDDPITEFGADDATACWIISVRQVSEGVDIPRLMVGVFLTNTVTELFFRQFIGRIARHEGTEEDREAYVFYPHHPMLNQYADKIMVLQALAVQRRNEAEATKKQADDEDKPSAFEYLGASDAQAAGLILPSLNITAGPAEARTIVEYATKYRIPETTAARIVRDQAAGTAPAYDPEEDTVDTDGDPLEVRLEKKRKAQNKRVGYWAILTGQDYDTLNGRANDAVGCRSVKVATEEQLKRRGDFIEANIRRVRNAA